MYVHVCVQIVSHACIGVKHACSLLTWLNMRHDRCVTHMHVFLYDMRVYAPQSNVTKHETWPLHDAYACILTWLNTTWLDSCMTQRLDEYVMVWLDNDMSAVSNFRTIARRKHRVRSHVTPRLLHDHRYTTSQSSGAHLYCIMVVLLYLDAYIKGV